MARTIELVDQLSLHLDQTPEVAALGDFICGAHARLERHGTSCDAMNAILQPDAFVGATGDEADDIELITGPHGRVLRRLHPEAALLAAQIEAAARGMHQCHDARDVQPLFRRAGLRRTVLQQFAKSTRRLVEAGLHGSECQA